MRPQGKRLTRLEAGVLTVDEVKPTVVIPTKVRLILSEVESLKTARILFAPEQNGDQVLVTEFIDIHDSRGNWSHFRLFLGHESALVELASPILFSAG